MKGFAKFLAYLQVSLGTIQMVRSVEQSNPETKQGPAKLDMVVNSVAAATQAVPEIAEHLSKKDAEGFATSIATTTVGILKAAGIFK